MTFTEAAQIVRSLCGQRPRDEAPPRNPAVIAEARRVLGSDFVAFFESRARRGLSIPYATTGQTDAEFKRSLIVQMLGDSE